MDKKMLTDTDYEKLSFFENGIMIYCEPDKQFIFARKQTTDNVKEKILAIQKAGRLTKFYPIEVHVSILRKQINESNIAKYYKKEVMRVTMNSKDFIEKYLHDRKSIKHNKTKGIMNLKDVLVATKMVYTGTKDNTVIFSLLPPMVDQKPLDPPKN